jgi:membrane protein DedA with SNARE-associated domain
MEDIFEIFGKLSYFGIFLLLIAMNASPILMPPTWIVLSSFYTIDPTFNILWLSIVGATGALAGRVILMFISRFFRRFMGTERKSSLDVLADFLKKKKYGYFSASFLFAMTPLPSNMLFIAYGIIRAKNISLFAGFWLGRAIAYYVMISISTATLKPFLDLFDDSLTGILVTDIGSMATIVIFACINWNKLITEKKLVFVKPKFWRV